MSFPLLEAVKSSELLMDGQSYRRQDVPFDGPPGLAAQGSWEGCLAVEDYVRGGLPPGRHRLMLKLGQAHSEEIRAKFQGLEAAAETPKARFRQVNALKETLSEGLLKRCVENWLTERDGGVEMEHAVRYYVNPDVKVHVLYDASMTNPRINGPVKTYIESRVAD